jgi:hypothetical protein
MTKRLKSIYLTEEDCFRLWQMHGNQFRYVYWTHLPTSLRYSPSGLAKSSPSKQKGTTIDIYWTWDWWHLDTSGKPIQCIFTVAVSGILGVAEPLTMNLCQYLGPLNQSGDPNIKNIITKLTYVYYRRSYNPNKTDETISCSIQHGHCSSLEFPTKVNMSSFSMRRFRIQLEVVRHHEKGF